MLQIRRIKPEDIQFVIELAEENNCFKGKLLSNIENFLICESEGLKCGCGCLVPSGAFGYMSWVMVKESHRRQKLGGAITKALLNIADNMDIKEVYAAGICGEFLSALGFLKCNDCKATADIKKVLDLDHKDCYNVKLEGYFKPCSHK